MRPEQRRHFAARLRKAENVVDEQQRVGAGRVAEILGHRQRRQRDAEPRTGRLVHLAEHHARLLDDLPAGLADLGLLHFEPQVGPFARSLADAGKHRVTAVRAGDARDQLGKNHRLAQPGPAEQPGLAAADERREQVDHLDAGLEDFGLGREIGDLGSVAMDRPELLGIHRPAVIDRLAEQIEYAAERFLADRYGDRRAGIDAFLPRTMPSVLPSATQRMRPPPRCPCTSPVTSIFVRPCTSAWTLIGVVDRRQVLFVELGVECRADHLRDAADRPLGGSFIRAVWCRRGSHKRAQVQGSGSVGHEFVLSFGLRLFAPIPSALPRRRGLP